MHFSLKVLMQIIIILAIATSPFMTVCIFKPPILEKKIIRLSFGEQTIIFEVVGNKIIKRQIIQEDISQKIKNRLYANTNSYESPFNKVELPQIKLALGVSRNIIIRDTAVSKRAFTIRGTAPTDLLIETFEQHLVPGYYWESFDSDATNGYVSWGDVYKYYGFRVYDGNWSMWAAATILSDTITLHVEGDEENDYTTGYLDVGENTSNSWCCFLAYLEAGRPYNVTIQWNSSEDVALVVLTPTQDVIVNVASSLGRISAGFVANETGYWYICADDVTDTSGVVTRVTFKIIKNAKIVIATGTVQGDGTDGPHYDNPTSSAWAEHRIYLKNGLTYNLTLDWNSTSDLDLYVYMPGTAPSEDGTGDDYYAQAYTIYKPETLDFTTNTSGYWTIAVDHYSSSGVAEYNITIEVLNEEVGGNLLLKVFYARLDIKYANYMNSWAYYNASWFDISSCDVAILEFYAWYNLTENTDYFYAGFLINNNSNLIAYLAEYTNASNGWTQIALTPPDEVYDYPTTVVFRIKSNGSETYEGVYIDNIRFFVADITLDGYNISPGVAYPGDTVQFGWYVNNPTGYIIPGVNLSVYLRPSGWTSPWKIYNYSVDLLPGVEWYYYNMPSTDLANAPLGYYDVRFVIWSGEVENSRIWHDTGWTPNYFQIKHRTQLSFSQTQYSGQYSDSVTVVVNLIDSDENSPLSNKNIALYYYNGTDWELLGTSTTDANGQAEFLITLTMDVGTYDLKAEFSGDDYYNASTAILTDGLVVDIENTVITFSALSYTTNYGDSITIVCYLKDDDDIPLSGMSIAFYYSSDNGASWNYITTTTTNNSGAASITYASTFLLDAGNYKIKAEFSGTKNYDSSQAIVDLIINPEITQISLGANSYTVNYTDYLSLSAQLVDDEENPVSDKTIYFEWFNGTDWQTLTSALTGKDGWAYAQVQILIKPGSYYIRATFAGDNNYKSVASENVSFIVSKEVTSISLKDVNGYYLDFVNITATITDNEGNGIGGLLIIFEYYDSTWKNLDNTTSESDGTALITVQLTMAPGTYTIRARFDGNEYYESTNQTAYLTVYKEITTTMLSDVSGNYSDFILIVARLLDDENNPISSKNITFYYNESGKLVYMGYALTNETGYAVLSVKLQMVPGSYQIIATFAGDDYYEGSEDLAKLIVNKEETIMNLDMPLEVNYTDVLHIIIQLIDNDNEPVIGANISLLYNSSSGWISTGCSAITNETGYAIIDWKVNVSPGEITLKLLFEGNDYYVGSDRIVNIIVNREQTVLMDVNGIGRYGDNATFEAVLTDNEGEPVIGVLLYFEIYNESTGTWDYIGNTTTNEKGYARLIAVFNIPQGNYTIRARFDGDEYFVNCVKEGELTFYKEITMLSVVSDVLQVKWKESIEITAYLCDDENNALSNYNVTFLLESNGQNTTIDTVLTNESGYATILYYADIIPGNYTIYAVYKGNQFYQASSTKVRLIVLKLDVFMEISPSTISGNYSDTINICIKLYDEHDEILENELVYVKIMDEGKIINTFESYTNASGYAEFILLLNCTPTQYQLVIEYPGSEYYNGKSIERTLIVNKEVTKIEIRNVTIEYSDSIEIPIMLTDNEEIGIPAKYINISIISGDTVLKSETLTTDKSGIAYFKLTAYFKPGEYVIHAEFLGDDYYDKSSKDARLVVEKEQTNLLFIDPPTEIYLNKTVTIKVSLKDNDNSTVVGAEIVFYLNSTLIGSSKTDEKGIAILEAIISDLPEGRYLLTAEFKGDDYYNASSSSVKVEVKLAIIPIELEFLSKEYIVSYTDSIEIGVKAVDEKGNNVSEILVYFYLNLSDEQRLIGSSITNEKGIASIMWTVQDDVVPGIYTIMAIFNGNNAYSKATTTATLKIVKEKTILSLYPVEGKYNSHVVLKAKLTTDDDEPIANATIRFYIVLGEPQLLGQNKTAYNGTTMLEISLLFDVGEYVIKAEFQGDEYFESTFAESKLIVKPAKLVVRVETDREFILNKETVIKVYTLDEYGDPLDDVIVEIYMNDTLTANGTTVDGVFVVRIIPNKTGIIILRIKAYKPNYETRVLEIEKRVVTSGAIIAQKIPRTLVYIASILTLAICVMLILIRRKRRRSR